MKPLNVGLLGIGTVGGGTAAVLKRNAEEIARRIGRPIRLVAVADLNVERAREVAGPALEYARDGHPILGRASATIATVADLFTSDWSTSADL